MKVETCLEKVNGVKSCSKNRYVSESKSSDVPGEIGTLNGKNYSNLSKLEYGRRILGRADSLGHGVNRFKKTCKPSLSSSVLPFSSLQSTNCGKWNDNEGFVLSSSSSAPNSESGLSSKSSLSASPISIQERDFKPGLSMYNRKVAKNVNYDSDMPDINSEKTRHLRSRAEVISFEGDDMDKGKDKSLVSSLESIEWSPEERITITDTNIPISRNNFYSYWKRTISHNESPRTPQFRFKGNNYSLLDLSLFGTSSESETSSISDSSPHSGSMASFSDVCGNSNADVVIGMTPSSSSSFASYSLPYSREFSNANNANYYAGICRDTFRNRGNNKRETVGISEPNTNANSPFIPIPSNMVWRNTLGLLLSQWTKYFSERHPFDSQDVENVIQFFIGLDNSTLNAVTSSLVYVSHCARYSQIRRLNGNL